MFGGADIPRVNSSRSRSSRVTVTTCANGSRNSFVGNPSKNFQRILKHPTSDAYYDAMVPTLEQFKKISLPILTITGQYDGDELGAMTFYRDHMANAETAARAKHFLII